MLVFAGESYIKEKLICFPYLELWNSLEGLPVHKENVVKMYIKKRHTDIIAKFKPEQIEASIRNYHEIYVGEKYFFTHKWNFWDFIAKGLNKFLPEMEPFKNYLNNSYKEPEEFCIPQSEESPINELIDRRYSDVQSR